jgi:flavin reductase (DIM6/NTAB) family NADH-FMN oxidoreductase RutF/DNA-binding IclR family transcriptional regulator
MTTHPDSQIDPATFREVLGNYPTGVAVVTAITAGEVPVAMVVGTFSSVSLDPPLVSFMPRRESGTFARLQAADHFTVSLLAHDQVDVSNEIARSTADVFSTRNWTVSDSGNPVVGGALASIDCRFEDILDAGDHFIVLGAVTSLTVHRREAPLVFFQGAYGGFMPVGRMSNSDFHLAESVAAVAQQVDTLADLSSLIGAEVSVLRRIEQDMFIVGVTPGGGQTRLGDRFPLYPPLGELFVAWDEAAADAWVKKSRDPDTHEVLRARLGRARALGWAASFSNAYRSEEVEGALQQYSAGLLVPATQRAVERVLARVGDFYGDEPIEPGHTYPIHGLVVPIFDSHNNVAFVLNASGFDCDMRGEDVIALAERLQGVARECSSALYSNISG